jgi:hypothetical protein
MFLTIVNGIIAVSKLVPVAEKLLDLLFKEWAKYKNIKIAEATTEAVKEAIETRDQREVESEQYSGKPSGVGTIRDESTIRVRVKKKD